jgi:tRNA pseudouridine55 synthase
MPHPNPLKTTEGILLVNKPKGKTSFSLVGVLRKILNVRTIGHAGTLDPMATGVMVLLIGKRFTTQSDSLTGQDKAYEAIVTLGSSTDTYDAEGQTTATNDTIPTLETLQKTLSHFNGMVEQTPPMFSAKKINGQKLYDLARQGKEVERQKIVVAMRTTFIEYHYPEVRFTVDCSKGTYIRSIAHDLGQMLGCEAHLSGLIRTKSGPFLLDQCIDGSVLFNLPLDEVRPLVLSALRSS